MNRRIVIGGTKEVTVGSVLQSVYEAIEAGATEESKIVSWYDPNYLADRMVYEVVRVDIEKMSVSDLLAAHDDRRGDTWNEIVRRLHLTEESK